MKFATFELSTPALVTGNVALLTLAPNVPRCALAIEEVFTAAGLPPGVFQSLLIELDHIPAILDDPRVHAVTLTGGDRAGRDVAARRPRAGEVGPRTRRERSPSSSRRGLPRPLPFPPLPAD